RTAISLAPDRLYPFSRKDLGAAALRRIQDRSRQQTVINRSFLRPEHRRFDFFAQRRFHLTRIRGAQWLRQQSEPVMQGDDRAEFRLCVVREKRLKRPLWPEA